MLTLSREIRFTKSQDGGILLDLNRGVFFHVNSVGARIVELLDQGHDRSSLVHTIREEFHVSEQAARNDIGDFLASLRQEQLLDGDEAAVRHNPGVR